MSKRDTRDRFHPTRTPQLQRRHDSKILSITGSSSSDIYKLDLIEVAYIGHFRQRKDFAIFIRRQQLCRIFQISHLFLALLLLFGRIRG